MGKILLLFIILFTTDSHAYVDTLWLRTFNGATSNSRDESFTSAIDNNGNLYTAGLTQSTISLLLKYNSSGVYQWQNASINTYSYDMEVSNDGFIYVVGTGSGDMILLKFNTSGDTIWKRSYTSTGIINTDAALLMDFDSQGNILVTGYTKMSTADMAVTTLKFDSNGNILWVSNIKGANTSTTTSRIPRAMNVDANGNTFITGTVPGQSGGLSFFTAKLTATGDTAWVHYDMISYQGRDIDFDNSGNIYVTAQSTQSGTYVIRTYKFSQNGNLIWVQNYGNGFPQRGVFTSQIEIDNNNIYVAGVEEDHSSPEDLNFLRIIKYNTNGDTIFSKRGFVVSEDNSSTDNILFFKLDQSGNLYLSAYGRETISDTSSGIVTAKYNSTGKEEWITSIPNYHLFKDDVSGLSLDANDNVYVTGSTVRNGMGYDIIAVKYFQLTGGVLQQYSGIPQNFTLEQNYPNPFNPTTKIKFSIPIKGNVSLKIYDISGKVIQTVVNEDLPAGIFVADFNGSKLASGVYFYQLISSDFTEVKKMMLVK